MDPNHTTSTLLPQAGGLMALSGLLMALCASVAYGGILWAAAACLFCTTHFFRLTAEPHTREDTDHEKDSV